MARRFFPCGSLAFVSIPYYHIDSFAGEMFAGNPAGVCIVPEFPADSIMQKIAAENRHSETAFVRARSDGDFDLRWFTPIVEDDLCGHATLAAAYALSLRGHDAWPVQFRTVSGLLIVHRDTEHSDKARFEMDFPARPAAPCEVPTGLLSSLGLQTAEVMREPRDFLVIVENHEIVRSLKPNIAGLAKIDTKFGGVMVTAAAETGADADYVCRFFAPAEGIDEDPATGSIQCTLAPYWAGRTGKQTFRVRQLSPRGARMWCTLAGDRVRIAGETRLYLQGTINL
jgi:PhzF family phenazine biosynthesis protein